MGLKARVKSTNFYMSTLENIALIIGCKYVGSTIVDKISNESMGLPLALLWVTSRIESRGVAEEVVLEGSLAAFIHKGKWYNALGATP